MTTKIEPKRRLLIEDQDKLAQPLFKTQKEYERFRRNYREKVKPILDQQALARARSEERARYHRVD